ncbi:molybdenum cofactor guanylyltransferase [Halodesulfovibrio spirochaetisodalis]|uniref:Probable molybdenum cofactor guanylyltransferase n=1 Tax=Halodesulfovibrio spirochaetisodalis TaxID=1560234 RepID=A0A1B7XLC3_9BACT|nr:molybdenum cofactor guanylyltransferase [Halodesulfovibrio spirochaetisodalis]OBQ56306.1 molybdopterin-guanine dinucleotide biosynthesis protein MobA [Halodesulfovibrio spirochaetisodalis]
MLENGSDILTGIVLAGGLSSRMGHDKTRIHVHGESEPDLLVYTCNLLASVCSEVWVSSREAKPHADGYLWVKDEIEGTGPIGGIMTSLRAAQGPVLVLSCDLPFMDSAMLQKLISFWKQKPEGTLHTTFLQEETGFIEALVSIYEFEALPLFEQAVDRGIYKLSRVVPEEHRHSLPYSQQESLPFFNVNYPADLEMARRIIAAI